MANQILFRLHWLLCLFLIVTAPSSYAGEPVLSRIAFGSCARQDKPQPIWDAVIETKPQLFAFLGDNIYADTEDMNVMRAKYALLGKQPGYQKLKQTCPIVASRLRRQRCGG